MPTQLNFASKIYPSPKPTENTVAAGCCRYHSAVLVSRFRFMMYRTWLSAHSPGVFFTHKKHVLSPVSTGWIRIWRSSFEIWTISRHKWWLKPNYSQLTQMRNHSLRLWSQIFYSTSTLTSTIGPTKWLKTELWLPIWRWIWSWTRNMAIFMLLKLCVLG